MFSYIQIFLCIIFLYSVTSKPFLGEFSFKKNFDVVFKPPPPPKLPPLKFGFLKEIITPLGKFSMKHAVEKRETGDLDGIKVVGLEKDIGGPPILPVDRYQVKEPKIEPLLESKPFLVPMKPVRPVMGPELNLIGSQIPYIGRLPPFVTPVPIPAPPSAPVVITPPPPKQNVPEKVGPGVTPRPLTGLFTDIGRDELINEYLKIIERETPVPVPLPPPITENQIVPVEKPVPPLKIVEAPKQVEEPPNPLVAGSQLAIFFGNFLMDMLNKFMGGIRQPTFGR